VNEYESLDATIFISGMNIILLSWSLVGTLYFHMS